MRPWRPVRRRWWVLLLVAGAAGAVFALRAHVRAAALVAQAIGLEGPVGRLAGWIQGGEVREASGHLATRYGPLPVRIYRPARPSRRAVLVVPGVNPAGLDDPRLVRFARALARAGLTAVTAALPDLVRYRITSRDVDRIEDAVAALAARRDLVAGRPPGVVGISFAGGLAIVAAGRPSVAGRLAFVASLGGYGDLPRVLRFLCTGEQPDGTRGRPHDYGLAVVLLNVVDRVVPADQVAALREAVFLFMEASWLDVVDPAAAAPVFARARARAAALGEPAATWMRWVNARAVEAAGPRLLPHALAVASDPALSPERSAPPRVPVYVLHGAGDTVIPAQESVRLAAWLRPRVPVRLLVTPLVAHAEVARAWRPADVWRLVAFWVPLLRE
jgi:dienelactone hydrolase